MDSYLTGAMIRTLRESRRMTQSELAEKLHVSDKAVSKWELGKGYPDLSLIEPIAGVFGISVAELMAGKAITNGNVASNILRSKFYVCPICGNIVHSMGEAVIHCHGVQLLPAQAEPPDGAHTLTIEPVEDEYYVSVDHPMTKQHSISFIAALSPDRLQLVKLYPEGEAAARVQMRGVQQILFYCNRDGLFRYPIRRK